LTDEDFEVDEEIIFNDGDGGDKTVVNNGFTQTRDGSTEPKPESLSKREPVSDTASATTKTSEPESDFFDSPLDERLHERLIKPEVNTENDDNNNEQGDAKTPKGVKTLFVKKEKK
jgi:hypothetical protein